MNTKPTRRFDITGPLVWLHLKTRGVSPNMVRFCCIEFVYFMAMASQTFTVIFMQENGLPATRVGQITALMNLVSVFAPPVWGVLSDKWQSKKKILMLCVACGSVLFAVVPASFRFLGVPALVTIIPVMAFFRYPTNSILDSWAVQTVAQEKSLSYGLVRGIGSIGFSIPAILYAAIIQRTGCTTEFTFYSYGLINIVTLFICTHQPEQHQTVMKKLSFRDMQISRLFREYYYVVMLIVHLIITFSMQGAGTFVSFLLRDIVGHANFVGTIMGIKAWFEVPLLVYSAVIVRRVGFRIPITITSVLCTLEQFLYTQCRSELSVFLVMLMHGTFYGMYLGSYIRYVAKLAPKGLDATAQTVIGAIGALSGAIVNLLGGILIDTIGIRSFYVVMSCIQLLGLIIFVGSFPLGRKLGKRLADDIGQV